MRKTLKNIVLPVCISIAILYIFFRDISINDIKKAFSNIPIIYLFLFILLYIIGAILRAIKYNVLISKKLKFKDIFLITLVRNFSVDLLPARSAALIFYSYLTKKKGIPLEEGASSFIVSMFYDALALSLLLGTMFFFVKTQMNQILIYIGLSFIFVVSIIIIFFTDNIINLLLKIKLINEISKLKNILININEYLIEHKKNSERIYLFFLSFIIRFIKYISAYILFIGIVKITGSIQSLSMFSFGLAGTELSSLLPIQGLGGFGTWELAFAFVFKSLGIHGNVDPRLTGLVIHITTQVWEYSIGLLAFLYISFERKKSQNKKKI